jgi:hypothetical protein
LNGTAVIIIGLHNTQRLENESDSASKAGKRKEMEKLGAPVI